MRISDWSSDVCSSDLRSTAHGGAPWAVERGQLMQAKGRGAQRMLKVNDVASWGPLLKDRKSVVEGKRVSVRVEHGGGRIIKKIHACLTDALIGTPRDISTL